MRKQRQKERLELFGGYYAECDLGDLFVVRENGIMRSPHYYCALEPLSTRVWALMRADDGRMDLLFSDKSWIMGVWEAYELARLGGKNGSVLSIHTEEGTDIIDDSGRHILSFRGYRHLGILDDRFIVVYDPDAPGPYVYIYDLNGELIAEGHIREAEKEALKWRPKKKD